MEVLGEHYQPVDVEAACIIQRNNSTSRSIEWSSPSPSSAPAIYSHKVEATPINNIPYSEENCKVEYPLHPVCRLLAFIGFLFSGAVGLSLAHLAPIGLMIFILEPAEAHNFIAYLGFTVSALLISMVLLEMATSGVLVVIWKLEGRVPCIGNLGLGSPFLGCLFTCSRASFGCLFACLRACVEKEIRECIDFINGLAVDDDVRRIGGDMEVGGTRSLPR